jgi:hypothetical protein
MKTWYVVYEMNGGSLGRITVEAHNEDEAKKKTLEERGWQGIKRIVKVEPM